MCMSPCTTHTPTHSAPFASSVRLRPACLRAVCLSVGQVFTGDGWSQVMATASGCDDFGYNCNSRGQSLVACLFFCTFVIFATFVMLNLG